MSGSINFVTSTIDVASRMLPKSSTYTADGKISGVWPQVKLRPIPRNGVLAGGIAAEAPTMESSVARHGRNCTWAELMKRVWALDVLECPRWQDACESSQRFTHLMQ